MDYSICCIKGCEDKVLALGLCNKHWRRNKLYGSPVALKSHSGLFRGMAAEDRFDMQYKVADSGCWEWTASKDRDGYGIFRGEVNEQYLRKAHRFSWALANRKQIPSDMVVCHSCDNPSCVNPAHLWLGSMAENQQDKWSKGRGGILKGDELPQAKLTEQQALSILKDPRPYTAIAADYGITIMTISDIKCRRSWSHLKVDEVARAKRVSPNKGVSSKITPDIVREIRSSTMTGSELSTKFSISRQTVCDIQKRRSWAHIE